MKILTNMKTPIELHKEGVNLFRDLIGEIPSHAVMKMYGRETCVMCGHPNNADEAVKDISSHIKQRELNMLKAVVEKVKEESKTIKIGDSGDTRISASIYGFERGRYRGRHHAYETIEKFLLDNIKAIENYDH